MPSVSTGAYQSLLNRIATLEDFADRLNHFWTFGLLLLLAAIISWHQNYGNPLYCWAPAHFPNAMVLYATDRCWNSYFIVYQEDKEEAMELIEEMFNDSFPGYSTSAIMRVSNKPYVDADPVTENSSLLTKMSTTRTLYQWLPVILCFQALLFKLPNILMYILHRVSGISFDKIAGLTRGYENLTLQERNSLCRQIGRYIYNWCQQCENCLPWRQLTLLWLFIKFLYCVNAIIQLSLVDCILAPENTISFGDVIAGNLFNKYAIKWNEAPVFPKQIMCDFSIRQFANIHKYTVQCNMSANYLNEFAYMFIWVWLVFVALVNCVSLLTWFLKTLVPVFRKRYIKKALSNADELDITTLPPWEIGKFCDLIGEDGVMALKLVGSNSSDLMVSEIVKTMWRTRAAMLTRPGSRQILASPTIHTEQNAPSCAPTVHVQPSAPSTCYPSLQSDDWCQGEKKMD